MKKPSKVPDEREKLRQNIIGLGERSIRKSYYPELQERIVELEHSNRELQEEIAERRQAQATNRKLTQQLQQAQKMEALGTLAGGVAHDFNNLLTAIIGYTELAQLQGTNHCEKTGCPVTTDLGKVLEASNRAKELVQQILTFSRKQDYEKKPLSVRSVVTEALRLLRSTLPNSIKIHETLTQENDVILANATQLHQILINLGTNAHHAMEKTGGTLAIEVERTELLPSDEKVEHLQLTPGFYLRLRVCDNGCGMERSVVDKIFDPYFTTKTKGRGTGMGLAVVHGIVKHHHGHINVYSEPGKGTTFVIYFPELNEKAPTNKQRHGGETHRGTERILLVDDEPSIANMQLRLLESLGYKVTAVTDAPTALELFLSTPDSYDIVMTDMTMPKLNGAELAQHILKLRPEFPIILCTGFSELINEEKADAIGIKAFAMKPLVRKTVANILRKVLDAS